MTYLTENQLRKHIQVILKELLGIKSKKGGTQLQRTLGHDEETWDEFGRGGHGGGGYGYDDDFDHDYYDDSDYDYGVD